MKLDQYLIKKNERYSVFANRIKIAPCVLHRFLKKGKPISFANAIKISQATKGKVTLADLAVVVEKE